MAEIEKLRQHYRGRAEFVIVYIKEAHPEDEWQMESNREGQVVYEQPKTFEARLELAKTFVDRMKVETPALVDDISNTGLACYAAWPERLYVIDTTGRITYKGGMGPFYFDPEELADFLRRNVGEPES
jgi:hypothetical protein